jgi:hypothetical protein
MVLNAAQLLAVEAPNGTPRIELKVNVPDRTLFASITAKALRKAQATINEHGADNIVLILQGHLIGGDIISEAGLVAQVKTKADAA